MIIKNKIKREWLAQVFLNDLKLAQLGLPWFKIGLMFTRLSLPTIYFPTIYLSTIYLPTIYLPTIYFPTLYLPTIYLPTIYSPTFYLPTIYLPTIYLPTIYLPTIYLPTIYSPTICLPTIYLPTIYLPTIYLRTYYLLTYLLLTYIPTTFLYTTYLPTYLPNTYLFVGTTDVWSDVFWAKVLASTISLLLGISVTRWQEYFSLLCLLTTVWICPKFIFCPSGLKFLPKTKNTKSKVCLRFLKVCPSGAISPNLVTLLHMKESL